MNKPGISILLVLFCLGSPLVILAQTYAIGTNAQTFYLLQLQ